MKKLSTESTSIGKITIGSITINANKEMHFWAEPNGRGSHRGMADLVAGVKLSCLKSMGNDEFEIYVNEETHTDSALKIFAKDPFRLEFAKLEFQTASSTVTTCGFKLIGEEDYRNGRVRAIDLGLGIQGVNDGLYIKYDSSSATYAIHLLD